jgi:hypothetical protein
MTANYFNGYPTPVHAPNMHADLEGVLSNLHQSWEWGFTFIVPISAFLDLLYPQFASPRSYACP